MTDPARRPIVLLAADLRVIEGHASHVVGHECIEAVRGLALAAQWHPERETRRHPHDRPATATETRLRLGRYHAAAGT